MWVKVGFPPTTVHYRGAESRKALETTRSSSATPHNPHITGGQKAERHWRPIIPIMILRRRGQHYRGAESRKALETCTTAPEVPSGRASITGGQKAERHWRQGAWRHCLHCPKPDYRGAESRKALETTFASANASANGVSLPGGRKPKGIGDGALKRRTPKDSPLDYRGAESRKALETHSDELSLRPMPRITGGQKAERHWRRILPLAVVRIHPPLLPGGRKPKGIGDLFN